MNGEKYIEEIFNDLKDETFLKVRITKLVNYNNDSILFYTFYKYCYANQWKTGNNLPLKESITLYLDLCEVFVLN